MKLRVGLIGFGMSAQTFHLPLLHVLPEFEISGFCSSQRESIQAQWPDATVDANIGDLVARSDIDMIVVTSPSGLHFEHAKAALRAGKHVVVEKPFTLTCAEAAELISLANCQKKVLSVFHNRRWDGDFLTVKYLIEKGKLGQIRYFESHFDRFRPLVRERWREQAGPGSGIVYDLGPHLVDQALCLFGMPQSLTARILQQRDGADTDDYLHLQLHYDDLEAVLHADMLCASENLRYKVQGNKGTYVKYGVDPQEEQLKAGMKPSDVKFGHFEASVHGMLYQADKREAYQTQPGAYLSFYQTLAQSIQGQSHVPVSPEFALQVMKVIEAAFESNALGKTLSVQ